MLLEITLYCLGGQGGVTTAKLIATAAMLEGFYSQAIPQFGPERRGAMVNAFVRISDSPIRRRSRIRRPDIVVIFDRKINANSAAETVVVNSEDDVSIAKKTYVLNATAIAEKYGLISAGWPILSTVMGGAIARVLDLPFSSLESAIKEELSGNAENVAAAKEAYEVVRWIPPR